MRAMAHRGARQRGQIGFAVVRGGDVVGEHEVLFLGRGGAAAARGTRATDRAVFARGALLAGQWLAGTAAGTLCDERCFYQ